MSFRIGNIEIGLGAPLFVMAGPCVIESEDGCLQIAERLVQISQSTGAGIIFKGSGFYATDYAKKPAKEDSSCCGKTNPCDTPKRCCEKPENEK